MNIRLESHADQLQRWPSEGEHVLAQFDESTVIVYQAYRPSIGNYAIEHGHFGGADFSFERMSWIKTNFLWMMYRSGWGTKPGQEVTLGLRLRRRFFDSLMRQAVASSFNPAHHSSREAWTAAVQASDVRLQWDPDHGPDGARQARRAVQLGLRGSALRSMATSELIEVIDLSPLVAEQRENAGSDWARLQLPSESVYAVGY